jgi:hypothetical protein
MPEVEPVSLHDQLLTGAPSAKLAALRALYYQAKSCRADAEARRTASPDAYIIPDDLKPWREFSALAGASVFSALQELVRQEEPSTARALAGDIMAQVLHPCAIGRLLEAYELRGDAVLAAPQLDIYRNLGGIGNEAAAKALMWLWGCKWDADIAATLGMCNTEVAQEFLIKQAREHGNVHVRATCIGYLNSPVTTAKAELLLERLENGEYNERFYAICKINILRLNCAATALKALRRKTRDAAFRGVIDETLPLLGQ